MKYAQILKASKAEAIFPVVAGLAVEADGYMLSAEQMDNVDAALAASEDANATVAQLQADAQNHATQLTTLTQSLQTAQESLATAEQQLTQLRADLQAEQDALTLAQADLTAAQQQVATLQAENDRLKDETVPPADTRTDADQVNKPKKKTKTSFDRLADSMLG